MASGALLWGPCCRFAPRILSTSDDLDLYLDVSGHLAGSRLLTQGGHAHVRPRSSNLSNEFWAASCIQLSAGQGESLQTGGAQSGPS